MPPSAMVAMSRAIRQVVADYSTTGHIDGLTTETLEALAAIVGAFYADLRNAVELRRAAR